MDNQKQPAFTHLHVHSEYSIIDGIANIAKMVERAADLSYSSLAITDHGSMYGAIDFYNECKERSINPIIGCEVYVAHQNRHSRTPEERRPTHLTLLAQNNTGYQNLMQLVTKSHLEGFYQKPRVDQELLALHSDGIICLSGCMSSQLASLIAYPGADIQAALPVVDWYAQTFKDRYFLEIQRHDHVDNIDNFNLNLIQLADRTGIPLVATNDSHYVNREDHTAHNLYTAIRTGSVKTDVDGLHLQDPSYYVKSRAEMHELFADLPHALDNAYQIGQQCHIEMDYERKRMPAFPTPDGQSADDHLQQLCEDGFRRLCPQDDTAYRERLEYELEVIRKTQFADYFLIVWDIIRFTRERSIQFGVRGSAAASLVLYCLDITVADPIHYGLVFERFLNLERKEMPDIDMDFQDDRREEPMNYVVERYGREQVAQIITFGRYGPKSAIKAAGKSNNVSYDITNKINKHIPPKTTSIIDAAEKQPDIKKMADEDPAIANLIQQAASIETIVHQIAPHPAGLVITSEPLDTITPLQSATDGDSNLNLTQYGMDPIAKLGILKMDFLGLTNLTILDKAMRSLPDAPQQLIDIPLDDEPTYHLLGTGNTTNVFQLERAGMQRYISLLKPNNLNDIAAMIALYRPGPMDNIQQFIDSKHGRTEITYPHPSMSKLLEETYGVIVYQDQVLHILTDFAGYTLGEADIVRKAMGKKIPKLMKEERDAFIAGAATQGYNRPTAEGIFDLIEPFAGYAFNKAHSVSYALISYWTAYFKANHTIGYMAAALNCRQKNDAYRNTIAECHRSNIQLLLPDINLSHHDSVVESPQAIRLGFSAIAGLGTQALAPIVDEREQNGPYTSLGDFCQRAPRQNLNSRQIETIIKAGILDSLVDRAHALANASMVWETINSNGAARDTGQMSMFATPAAQSEELPWTTPPADHVPATPKQKAQWENTTLGISLSWKPNDADTGDAISSLADLPADDKAEIAVAGFIESITKKTTRDQRQFLQTTLSLSDGSLEVMVWPNTLENHPPENWELNKLVRIEGTLTHQDDGPSLAAETLAHLDTQSAKAKTDAANHEQFAFTIEDSPNPQHAEYNFKRALRILIDYPGPNPVVAKIDGTMFKIETISVNSTSEELLHRIQNSQGLHIIQV